MSTAKKDGVEDAISKYDGEWSIEEASSSVIAGDHSLVMKSKARHSAIVRSLSKTVRFADQNQFIVQYEVKFQEGQDCGGAYLKLLSEDDSTKASLEGFNDKTPYTIMFGPDKCGMDSKLHFIVRHKNPKTGNIEEKHATKPQGDLEKYFTDKRTHLYTLVLNKDNTFEIFVDQQLINSGSLLKDMDPPINPPKEIEDPTDSKPTDWDDREKIPDASATKPADWDESEPATVPDEAAVMPEGWLVDEPKLVPDASAERPQDWDSEMDGEWEAPKVDNPKCKEAPGCGEWSRPTKANPKYRGKWSAPMVDNPAYRGVWKARMVPNPDYAEDSDPYSRLTPITAVGIEIWSMTEDIAFDNMLVVDSKKEADRFAAETWAIKSEAERRADKSAQSVVDAVREATTDRPWIWFIVAGAVLVPVVLIAYCCCRSTSSITSVGPGVSMATSREEDLKSGRPVSPAGKMSGEGVSSGDEEEAEVCEVDDEKSGDEETDAVAGKGDVRNGKSDSSESKEGDAKEDEKQKQSVRKRPVRKE